VEHPPRLGTPGGSELLTIINGRSLLTKVEGGDCRRGRLTLVRSIRSVSACIVSIYRTAAYYVTYSVCCYMQAELAPRKCGFGSLTVAVLHRGVARAKYASD